MRIPDSWALAAFVAGRRRMLRLELLEVNRRSGVALLDLLRLEREEGISKGTEALDRLAAALEFGSARELLWAAAAASR